MLKFLATFIKLDTTYMQKLYIFLIVISFLVSSCRDNDSQPSLNQNGENVIESIYISISSRGDDDPGSSDGNTDGDNQDNDNDDDNGNNEEDDNDDRDDNEGEEEELTTIEPFKIPFDISFDSQSVVFVSQKTDRTNPFRTQSDIYPYKYKVEYDQTKDPENDWYDENVYNFTPRSTTNPLEWFKIGNTGSYLNGYGLYALYFPLQTEMTWEQENDNILYSVAKDQTDWNDLVKSDILGAYHSTATLFSRLTFRMFHLMTYIGVRLYVPVYDPVTKTGYYDSSLSGAYVENANNKFSIEWNQVVTSDYSGPKVQSPVSTDKIKMYLHPVSEEFTERPIIPIKYTDYVYDGYLDQGLENNIDHVRVYDFSVLVPMQESFDNNNDGEVSQELPDLLSFWLQGNSGADNIYYFKQSYVKNDEETGKQNVIKLDQGAFQYLELYLPRVGNKVVFMGGHINKWDEHSMKFPLKNTEEEEN